MFKKTEKDVLFATITQRNLGVRMGYKDIGVQPVARYFSREEEQNLNEINSGMATRGRSKI